MAAAAGASGIRPPGRCPSAHVRRALCTRESEPCKRGCPARPGTLTPPLQLAVERLLLLLRRRRRLRLRGGGGGASSASRHCARRAPAGRPLPLLQLACARRRGQLSANPESPTKATLVTLARARAPLAHSCRALRCKSPGAHTHGRVHPWRLATLLILLFLPHGAKQCWLRVGRSSSNQHQLTRKGDRGLGDGEPPHLLQDVLDALGRLGQRPPELLLRPVLRARGGNRGSSRTGGPAELELRSRLLQRALQATGIRSTGRAGSKGQGWCGEQICWGVGHNLRHSVPRGPSAPEGEGGEGTRDPARSPSPAEDLTRGKPARHTGRRHMCNPPLPTPAHLGVTQQARGGLKGRLAQGLGLCGGWGGWEAGAGRGGVHDAVGALMHRADENVHAQRCRGARRRRQTSTALTLR